MEKYKSSYYQWKQIELLISPKTLTCGRARRDTREFINRLIWVLRADSPCCSLPKDFVSWHTIYNNFRKWSQESVMENIFKKFTVNTEETTQIQIDSTHMKVHHHSGGIKKGNTE